MATNMNTQLGLDDAARARVDAAIADAERATSGEIVAGLAAISGRYRHVKYEAGLAGAVGAILLYAAVDWLAYREWPHAYFDVFLLIITAGFVVGALCARLPAVARLIAGEHVMLEQCEIGAKSLFVAHGVAGTAAHTGVVLYVSLFERMTLIRGDSAITAKLGPDDYRQVVEAVIAHLKAGRVEEGLKAGVARLGELLAKHFPRGADDKNELPDKLYIV